MGVPTKTIVTISQQLLKSYEQGKKVNVSYLSKKVESLKDHLRFQKDLLKIAKRSGDPERIAAQEQKVAEIEELRGNLIAARNALGGEVPTPIPREAAYKKDLPYESTPFEQIMSGDPSSKFVQGRASVLKDPAGAIHGVESRIAAGEIGGIDTGKPKAYEETGGQNQALGASMQRELPGYAMGGSFVDTINQERQILMASQNEAGYTVTVNPNLDVSQSMDAFFDEKFESFGFVETSEGTYFFPKEQQKEPEQDEREFFNFSEPFYKDAESNERFDFTKPVDIRKAEPEEKEFFDFTQPYFREPVLEVTPSGLAKTPITEFFESRPTKGVEEFFAGIEDRTGFYVKGKDSPTGIDIRLSQGIGFIGESAESAVKIGASVPVLAFSLYKAGEFTARTQNLNKDPSGYVTQEERLKAASDFGASLPYLSIVPVVVAFGLASRGGAATKVISVDPTTGKAVTVGKSIMTPVSSKIGLKEVVLRGSSGIQQVIPKGHPAYSRELFRAATTKVTGLASKAAPVARVAKTSGTFATATAGMQAFYDVGSGKGFDLEKTQRAFIGGALFGGAMQAAVEVKPVVLQAAKGAKAKITQTFSFKNVLDKSFQAGGEFKTDVNIFRMLARTPADDLATIPSGSPVYAQAQIVNVFNHGMVARTVQRAAVRTAAKPVSVLPPAVVSPTAATREAFSQPRQKFIQLKKVGAQGFDAMVILPSSFTRQTDKKAMQEAIREEAIEQDILREAGRTKGEQVARLREGTLTGSRFGLRTRTGLRSKTSQAQREMDRLLPPAVVPSLVEIEVTKPRVGQPPRLRDIVTERPPTQILIPTFGFSLPSEPGKKSQPKFADISFKTDYSPSVLGLELGLKEKDIDKLFSPVAIRGTRRRKK